MSLSFTTLHVYTFTALWKFFLSNIVNFDTRYNSKLWFSGHSNPFEKWETDVTEYIINASVPFSTCPASHIWHTFFIHMRHFALILFLCYILDETIQINKCNLFFVYFQVSKRCKKSYLLWLFYQIIIHDQPKAPN